jgi:hypothetical protein
MHLFSSFYFFVYPHSFAPTLASQEAVGAKLWGYFPCPVRTRIQNRQSLPCGILSTGAKSAQRRVEAVGGTDFLLLSPQFNAIIWQNKK